MMNLRRRKNSGQTILELVFVTITLVFFFTISYLMISLFEVSQKQSMLARTQAFIELGNYANFGYSRHGEDDPTSEQSQVIFVLGENSAGTRVDLANVSPFKKMVEGELEIDVTRSVTQDPSWEQYRFPRRITRLFVRQDNEDLVNFPLEQTMAIAHNRSLSLSNESGNRDTGEFSGSIHYMRVQDINNALAQNAFAGEGLIDNTAAVNELLSNFAKEDSSLSDAALRAQADVNLLHSIEGGAQAALISLALQLAMQYGFQQLSAAFSELPAEAGSLGGSAVGDGAVSGSLAQGAGGAVGGAGGFNFGFPSLNLIEGATLHNIGQAFTFSSQVLNTVNLGASLAGKNIEGLGVAAAVTGGIGGISSGLSTLGSFSSAGGFAGDGLGSEFFGGLSQVSAGAGSIVGLVDPDAGRAFGLASTGLGLGAGISGLNENWSTWAASDGGVFKQMSGVGGVLSQAGGLAGGLAPGSGLAQGLSLAGSGLGTIGGIGTFSTDFQAGKFQGKAFETMAVTGGLIASASGVGSTLAQMTGNDELAEAFGYGMIGGGALALAGTAGIIGKAAIEAAPKVGEKISAMGDKVASAFSRDGPDSGNTVESFSALPEAPKTNFEKLNEAFHNAQIANQAMAAGLSAALGVKGADGVRESFAGAPDSKLGSAGAVLENLNQVNVQEVAQQMPESQATRFTEYFETFKQSMTHIDERTRNGETPDSRIVQRGLEASQNAQAILDAQQKLPKAGTEQRLALQREQYQDDMKLIRATEKDYQNLFQEDAEIISLMYQAEQSLDGKRVLVADSERRDLLEERGNEFADRIREHRENYYPEDSHYTNRLKKAEHHWKNMEFQTPAAALGEIQTSLQARELQYQRVKSALVNRLQACASSEAC